MCVVARQPRQQPRSQERRLARARRAEDDEQPRRHPGAQAAQPIGRLDDRRVAAEEDPCILRIERLQAAVGRAVRLTLRRPGEELRIEPRLLQPPLEANEAGLRQADVLFFVRAGPRGREQLQVLPAREVDHLPHAGQLWRQVGDRLGQVDENGEKLLVQAARQLVFLAAPARGEPTGRDDEHHRLAARRRRVQCAFPPLARRDAAIRIDVEENVVPAFGGEPIAQRDGLEVVVARMAEEDARHGAPSLDPQDISGVCETFKRNIAQRLRPTVALLAKSEPTAARCLSSAASVKATCRTERR